MSRRQKNLQAIRSHQDCGYRRYAHVFDLLVHPPNLGNETHPTQIGRQYIDGAGGIGWYSYFRCHRTGEIYAVHCSDGVEGGKSTHCPRDYQWMEDARQSIIDRTRLVRRGDIKLSWREWRLVQGHTFTGWLDPLPEGESRPNVSDGRLTQPVVVGAINGRKVIVTPDYRDSLPPVGRFDFEDLSVLGLTPNAPKADTHPTSTFSGAFAAAFANARPLR